MPIRRRGNIRKREWLTATSGEALSILNDGFLSSVSLATHAAVGAAGNVEPFTKPTLSRVRGTLYMRPYSSSSTFVEGIAQGGIIPVEDQPGAPTPFDPRTFESARWLWNFRVGICGDGFDAGVNFMDIPFLNVPVDVRAMVKVNPRTRVDFIIAFDGNAVGGIKWSFGCRALIIE